MASSGSLPLRWLTRDAWLLVAARAFRTFAQTSISVFFAIYLTEVGYSATDVGMLATIGSAGSATFAFLIVFFGDAMGRRKLFVGFSIVMALGGLGFAFTEDLALLAIVAFFVGSLAITGGGPRGPLQPLELATLPDTIDPARRTDMFSVIGIVERLARFAGSLAAALPALFVVVFGVSEVQGYRIMFVVYAGIMLMSAMMYWFLSPPLRERRVETRWQNPLTLPSRRTIFTIAAFFSMDDFATRFVFFSLVALFFKLKFGLDLTEVSYLLAVSTLLSAVSLWFAAKLANTIGLMNTIVFTHVPAVLFTFAVPFAPWAWLAVTLWFMRAFFSQMDTSPKQSYTMAIVNWEERTAMAGVQNVSQATVGTFTPWIATALFQGISMTLPFVAAGVLKSVYLAGLYQVFKDVHPPEEVARHQRKADGPKN